MRLLFAIVERFVVWTARFWHPIGRGMVARTAPPPRAGEPVASTVARPTRSAQSRPN